MSKMDVDEAKRTPSANGDSCNGKWCPFILYAFLRLYVPTRVIACHLFAEQNMAQ